MTGKLGAFLALIGGTYAIKAFISDTIKTNTQLYFLARNLGMGVQSLSAWGTVAKEFGGTAEGLQGTLSHLSMEATNFALRGQSSLIPFLSMMRVGFDQLHPDKMLLAIGAWVQAATAAGAARPVVHNILEQMGIDEGTINAMFAGTKALQSYLDAAKKVAPTEKEAADAAKMNAQLVLMDAHLKKIGTDLLEKAAPALGKFFDLVNRFGTWIQNNQTLAEWIGGITVAVAGLAASLTVLGVVLPAIAAGFSAITGPVGLAVAGIAAVTAAILELVAAEERRKEVFNIPGKAVASTAAQRLARGIATAEGFFRETGGHPNIPQRANNPGDIEYGEFAKAHGATGSISAAGGQQIAVFPDVQTGMAALYALIQSHAGMKIGDILKSYAGTNPDAQRFIRNALAASGGLTAGQVLPAGTPERQFPEGFWSGLKAHGILRMPEMPSMAPPNIASRNITNHIGQITINTQATDAKKIAGDLGRGTDWLTFATQSNSGSF